MANQEHLDILKQGVEVWNEWREHHQDVQPDLSEVDLKFAELADASVVTSKPANGGRVKTGQRSKSPGLT